MESVLGRYRNLIILVAVLFAQVIGLGVQVRRSTENESTRLIRIWVVSTVTPLERVFVWVQTSSAGLWHNYFYLRGVRAENRQLKAEIERLRLEQVRLNGDAEQARRLQALLAFREQFISQTLAAQVIGTSGSEQSRSIYIDKGSHDGVKQDQAVITADGVVGKVLRVFHSTSQVLLVNDQSSGVGALLQKSRLQGVLRGTPAGEVVLEKVMSDEQVQPGEAVVTSGGDRVFPKGLPVGTVARVSPGPELFLNIRVKPAADLGKLEEVLVVTKVEDKEPVPSQTGPVRAVEILAQRLPSVPEKPAGSNPPAAASVGTAPGGPNSPAGAIHPDKAPGVGLTKPTQADAGPGKPTAVPATTAVKPPNGTTISPGSAGSAGPGASLSGGRSAAAGAATKPAAAIQGNSPKPANAVSTVKTTSPQKPGSSPIKATDPGAPPVSATPPAPKPEQAGQNPTPAQDSPQ